MRKGDLNVNFKKEDFTSNKRLFDLYQDIFKKAGENEDPWLLWGLNKSRYKSMPNYYIPFYFNGETEVMFVAYQPSTEEFPSEADFLFADVLIEAKLIQRKWELKRNLFVYYEGVFITDFIKYRGKVSQQTLITQRDISFLKREFQIINPKTIIAVGNETQKLLWRYRNEIGLDGKWNTKYEIPKLNHYAYPFRWKKRMSINDYKEEARKLLKF